jgi:2,4-dienoyl-CoA reductase-like NADH-dependent reductase (Old Yellow Enzyme family)
LHNQIIGHLVAHPCLVPLFAAQACFLTIRLAAITVVSRVVSILLSPFHARGSAILELTSPRGWAILNAQQAPLAAGEGTMIFDPFTINGKLTLGNRVVLAPLYLTWDGRSDEFRAFYVRRAQGGVGLVVAPQSSPGGVADWADPDFGASFRPLVEGCHAAGARIALQVFSGSGVVDELAAGQLASIPQQFARAAAGVRKAGFDALDVHGAHHSLFMHLLSPFQNHRTDRYGGPPQDRWRVQVETVEAIRAAVGEDFPILFRFSTTDFVPGGVDLSLTVPYARALEAAGVDCLDVSAGTSDSPQGSVYPGAARPLGYFADLAAAIRAAVDVPVIAVGKIATRQVAESILQEGKADLVALGRSLIADPDWPRKLAEGRDGEIVPCLWDNVGCLRDSIQCGLPIRCIQNPDVGFEHET